MIFFLGLPTKYTRFVRRMSKKYQFPLQLYLIFENLEPMVYTHDNLTPNHYVMFIPAPYLYNITSVLKNEVFFNFNYLAEISAIDTLKFSKFLPEMGVFFKKNRILLFYIFYMYLIKLRLTIFITTGTENSCVQSIENLYPNSSWLEREVSEMFQINYVSKRDNRNLLLDYSQNEFPLLKDFPTEGYKDLYYNFNEENLTFMEHQYIEL